MPLEIHNRLAVYDFAQNASNVVGTNGVDTAYPQSYANFGPRLGLVFDPTGKGKTVIRTGVGLYYDRPVTSIVSGLGSNPPFSTSVNNTSNVSLANPFNAPAGTGSAIQAIDPGFRSGRVLSYNFNVQQEVLGTVVQVSYVGSQGRRLRLIGDYNQGIGGCARSRVHEHHVAGGGVEFELQRCLDFSGQAAGEGADVQHIVHVFEVNRSEFGREFKSADSELYNIAGERGLSDFDARQRFVLSGVYLLPFDSTHGGWKYLVNGWSVSPIVNLQSGIRLARWFR